MDAIRKRVQRGTIPHERDEAGRVWVLLEAASNMQNPSSTVQDIDQDSTGHPWRELLEAKEETIAELRDHAAYLERRLERQMEEEHEARRRTDTLLAQLSQANAAMAHQIRELTAPPEPPDEPEREAGNAGGVEGRGEPVEPQTGTQEEEPVTPPEASEGASPRPDTVGAHEATEEPARKPWYVRWLGG